MQMKSFLAHAGIVALVAVTSAAPGLARQAQKTTDTTGYQLQSASSSYASAPQGVAATSRSGQCWIAADASRPYGYMGSCANPLAQDPSLDPTYNPEW